MDQFLAMCNIHLIMQDDVTVQVFLYTLVGLAYDWYLYIPVGSITCLNDLEYVFLSRYAKPIAYHTLLTQLTQIHLDKNERIRYFHLKFLKKIAKYTKESVPQ